MTGLPRSGRSSASARVRRRRAGLFAALLLACVSAGGCASRGGPNSEPGLESDEVTRAERQPEAALEAQAEAEGANAQVERQRDPWQGANRGLFWFNEQADIYLILPIAKGWRFATPQVFRTGIRNLSDLSRMSVILANNMLQLQPRKANDDVLRIVFNASFGIGGLIDVATRVDIPEHDEDFGQTMAFWGMPSGPYCVLPVFGPSTVRGAVGRAVDAFGTLYSYWLPLRWLSLMVNTGELLNLRAYYIEEVDENRRESFDYYVFMRDAYLQNRAKKIERSIWIRDAEVEDAKAEAEADLYYIDDDEDYDEYE
jgi:phospholipid-binding lipoprotein MlaA